MGHLHYGGVESFEFDDRTLTHLRTVILSKLNLQESLAFTWTRGDQQHSIWLHPTVPLHFEFDVAETAALNTEWVELLLGAANSPSGLHALPEPKD